VCVCAREGRKARRRMYDTVLFLMKSQLLLFKTQYEGLLHYIYFYSFNLTYAYVCIDD